MKIGFLLMLSIIVAGCATMADTGARLASLGVVSEEVSDFDGATVVRMSPAHVYVKKMLGGSFMLGGNGVKSALDSCVAWNGGRVVEMGSSLLLTLVSHGTEAGLDVLHYNFAREKSLSSTSPNQPVLVPR